MGTIFGIVALIKKSSKGQAIAGIILCILTIVITINSSFSIQVEAVDANGSRIANDYIYANNLNAGQSQEFKLFEYVESDKLNSMKNATFKIVEVSMY